MLVTRLLILSTFLQVQWYLLLAPAKAHGANPLVNFHVEKYVYCYVIIILFIFVFAIIIHGSFINPCFKYLYDNIMTSENSN